MMLSSEPFRIYPRHWLLALFVAIMLHSIIFLSYQSKKTAGVNEINESSIVIRLKKITSPPKVAQPPIMKPKIEPLPITKPKPKPLVKPKAKPEPKLNAIAKPVESFEAKAEPIQDDNSKSDDVAIKLEETGKVDPSLKFNYESQLLTWLHRHKKYPNLARRRGQQGTVILEFVINAQGKLLSHKIKKASEHAALNAAVERMVKKASPMPPIPQELQGDRTQFSYTIPIHFTLKK